MAYNKTYNKKDGCKMKVSIIIPTLNEEKTIGKLLDSLLSDKYSNKEIIVVDGGSTDNTLKICKEKGVKVIHETGKKCPANARNIGAKYSSGDILCFLDGDICRVSENFIANAVRYFDENTAGVTCNREFVLDTFIEKLIYFSRNNIISNILKAKLSKKHKYFNFIRKDIFWRIRYPLIGYGEDRVFWNKLKKLIDKEKLLIKHADECVVYQHLPHTLGEYKKQQMWYGRTILMFVSRKDVSIFEKIVSLYPLLGFVSVISLILFAVFRHLLFFIISLPFLIKSIINILDGLSKRNIYILSLPLLDITKSIYFTYGFIKNFFGYKKVGR